MEDQMAVEDILRKVMADALQLGNRGAQIERDTPLLGNIPELDSMAVVTLITAIEEQFNIYVEDDEVSAETFETFGNLTDFVAEKIAG